MSGRFGQRVSWGPTIDGAYYVGHPMSVGFLGAAHIPLLAGLGLRRVPQQLQPAPGLRAARTRWPEALRQQSVTEQLGELAPAAQAAFRPDFPRRTRWTFSSLDDGMRRAAVAFTKKRACDGGVAYNYFFTLSRPL